MNPVSILYGYRFCWHSVLRRPWETTSRVRPTPLILHTIDEKAAVNTQCSASASRTVSEHHGSKTIRTHPSKRRLSRHSHTAVPIAYLSHVVEQSLNHPQPTHTPNPVSASTRRRKAATRTTTPPCSAAAATSRATRKRLLPKIVGPCGRRGGRGNVRGRQTLNRYRRRSRSRSRSRRRHRRSGRCGCRWHRRRGRRWSCAVGNRHVVDGKPSRLGRGSRAMRGYINRLVVGLGKFG